MQIKEINQLHFDIVNGCQLECVGCPSPLFNKKITYIEPANFEKCIKNLDVDKVKVLRLFNYGEPLLHPQLTKIGEVIKSIKHIEFKRVELSTNAQHVNWDDFSNLIKLNIVTHMVVSCDGDGSKDSYEKLRPPAKWHKLLDFFEKCSKIINQYSPSTKLITRTTIESLSDIDRWKMVLEPYGFEAEFRGWKQLPQANNMTGRDNKPSDGVCFFVEDKGKLFINAEGTVVPCCAHPYTGNFGNLKLQKFSEIVHSERRKEFVEKLENARHTIDICNVCEFGPKDNKGLSAGQNMPIT